MSNINFTCPHCSFQKQLPASAEGMQGNCPSCNAVVTIRADAPTNPAVLPQQTTPQQQRSQQALGYCPKCGSSTLEPLPPNQISHNPGYRCIECRSELRTSKSTWSLLSIFVLGIGFSIGGVACCLVAKYGEAATALGVGLPCGIWAYFRLRLPKILKAPRRSDD